MTSPGGLRAAFVVLTTGNRPAELAAAVESALAQGTTGAVLVVVQGASVAIPSDVAGGTGVEVLRLEKNAGIPGGRDAGMRAVDADVVFFLDDDARYARPDVAAGVLGDMAARPSLAVVSLRIVDEEGETLSRHVPRIGGGSAGRSGPTTTFLGGACAIRRSAYLEVGGYHAAYWYGHEELDLAWRLLDAGWDVWYEGAPAVIHPHAPVGASDGSRWSLLGRNRVRLARRNLPHPIDWAHTVVWLGIGLVRARSAVNRRSYWTGWWSGWHGPIDRRTISWATVLRMCRLGRPPIV
jgi:GT2 family glycosyltransferase